MYLPTAHFTTSVTDLGNHDHGPTNNISNFDAKAKKKNIYHACTATACYCLVEIGNGWCVTVYTTIAQLKEGEGEEEEEEDDSHK